MSVTNLALQNFKSFNSLSVELRNFNVLIGANASGKSNFTQIFKFIKDIRVHGLDNAVSLQGGVEFLRNINLGSSVPLSLSIRYNDKYTSASVLAREREMGRVHVDDTEYKFAIGFKKTRLSFDIIEDRLIQRGEYISRGPKRKDEQQARAEIVHSINDGKLKKDVKIFEGESIRSGNLFPTMRFNQGAFRTEQWDKKTLILQTPLPHFPSIGIYDFDPKLPKKATPITGKVDLEEDGANLAIVIKQIISRPSARKQLADLFKDLLPFISNVDIEKFSDRSLLFKLKEIYFKDRTLPASSLSDGTINVAALIVALFFEHSLLTVIEEPERNIHPSLISKVASMMKEAALNKQIVVTTQNAEFVKHAGIESLLFVSRDKQGFSEIYRPGEKEAVKAFLQNEIGIEELYIQNLLGVSA